MQKYDPCNHGPALELDTDKYFQQVMKEKMAIKVHRDIIEKGEMKGRIKVDNTVLGEIV